MKNFKSHANTTIDFTNGVNIIVGENGAGKSTILEGISFALFKQHTAKKIDDLVSNGQKQMYVELLFNHNGFDYKIVRIKRNNLKSVLYKKVGDDYMELYSGDKEVAQHITEILSMDSDLFLNAVYVRQGEIANLITKTAGEKKQLIGKLLGIDSLEKAWKDLGPYISNYEKEAIEKRGTLHDLDAQINTLEDNKNKLSKMNTRLNELSDLIEINKDTYENLKGALQDLDKQKDIYFTERAKYNFAKQQLQQLQDKQNSIQIKLNEIEDEKSKLKTLERDYEREIADCQKQQEYLSMLYDLNREISDLSQDIAHIKELKQTLLENCPSECIPNDENVDLKKVLHMVDEAKDEAFSEVNDMSVNIGSLETDNRKIEKSLNDLNDTNNECPICRTKLNDEKKIELVTEYKTNIRENERKISEYQKIYRSAKQRGQYFRMLSDMIMEHYPQISLLESKQNDLDEKQQKAEDLKKNIVLTADECEQRITELKLQQEDYNRIFDSVQHEREYKSRYQELEKEIKDLQDSISQMKNIEYDSEYHDSIRDKTNKLEEHLNILSIEKSSVSGQYKALYETTEKLYDKVQRLREIKHDVETSFDFITLLADIREHYSKNGVQNQLRLVTKPLVEKYTKDIFNGFGFNYYDLTIDEDYEVTLHGPEGESSSSMISGGEKIAVALSLRLGITQAISENLDTIMLDEPTIHLDDTRKDELLDLLSEVNIPQMIVVTHDLQMENSATNLITIKKVNGVSYKK